MELKEHFGPIDIYLFDQLHKGNIPPESRVLDAGCGGGRNLVYLLRSGYDVFGSDENPRAIEAVRELAARLRPDLPVENFRPESIGAMSFAAASMDAVLSNAVLHFAEDDAHFHSMLAGSWRPVRPGGLFFCRLASSIGMEGRHERLTGRRHRLLDGSTRYLVDERMLLDLTEELRADLVEPIKTTVVQSLRSMTTWVLRKRG